MAEFQIHAVTADVSEAERQHRVYQAFKVILSRNRERDTQQEPDGERSAGDCTCSGPTSAAATRTMRLETV